MSAIRDFLEGLRGTAFPRTTPLVFGDPQYSVSGKYVGTEVLSGHPIAGTWVAVAFASKIKLSLTDGVIDTDPTAPMQGEAVALNTTQNAAILWGIISDDGTATFDGMSPNFTDPSCLLPAASSVPYGGKIFYIADGIWNFAPATSEGAWVDYAYPLVWDGTNTLTAVLLFNPENTFSLLEYNTFVRCNIDVAAIESWLGQHTCPTVVPPFLSGIG